MKLKPLTVAGLIIALLITLWFAFPAVTARGLLSLSHANAGLSRHSVATQFGTINYLEGGRGETILLLHGIFARKEHWASVMRELVDDYRVIALDLPGFGDNPLLEFAQYDLNIQQQQLTEIIDALDLKSFHIGANSMGAAIASLYIAANPSRVKTMSFIGSPAGVQSPVRSDMEIALSDGQIPLVVRSADEFHARNEFLAPNMPYIPGPVVNVWMNQELDRADSNIAIWNQVNAASSMPDLLRLAAAIDIPTLIVWCKQDRIFHISGAYKLDASLPDSTLAIPESCGHVPMLDAPSRVVGIYRDFLSHQERKGNIPQPPQSHSMQTLQSVNK